MTTDLLAKGAAWLTEQAAGKLATAVTYRAAEDETSVAATWGNTEFDVADADGMTITGHVTDFIIADSELGTDPLPGDVITIADGMQYEVMRFAGEGCWRWTTAFRTARRIHTREIGESDAGS